MEQQKFDYEVDHIVSISLGLGAAIKARRCANCNRILFVNVGIAPEDIVYFCPSCRI